MARTKRKVEIICPQCRTPRIVGAAYVARNAPDIPLCRACSYPTRSGETVVIPCARCGIERTASFYARNQVRELCNRCSITTHGEGRDNSRLYRIWSDIKTRAGRASAPHKSQKHYRDRGILMCEEWESSYLAFRDWATTNGYADHLECDRRDNDGGYSPDNCRWVTHAENNRNKRTTKLTAMRVADIKARMVSGARRRDLISEFGVSKGTIASIRSGKNWADVEPADA